MNIDQFTDKLNNSIETLAGHLPSVIEKNALNTVAVMKDRIIQRGGMVGGAGEETSFPAYSEAYEKKKTREGKQGAGSANRLVYTGDMFRKLNIVGRINNGLYYAVTVGGKDQFSQDKLDYNSERYGDVLRLTNKEIKTLEESATEDLLDIFKNSLE